MILLTQNSSRLTLSCRHLRGALYQRHGLKIKCPLCGRLIFCAHGIMIFQVNEKGKGGSYAGGQIVWNSVSSA